MKLIPPAKLPTANLETILIDEVGSPQRLLAVVREYHKRTDKDPEIFHMIAGITVDDKQYMR